RLGVEGDWDHPYTTMDYAAEAQIAREIMKFAANGTLYRGSKPVMWSVVEKTALAEAEADYEHFITNQLSLPFPIRILDENGPALPSCIELAEAEIVIWTTTPWTIPGNRAIARGRDMEYVVLTVMETLESALTGPGRKLVVANSEKLIEEMTSRARI